LEEERGDLFRVWRLLRIVVVWGKNAVVLEKRDVRPAKHAAESLLYFIVTF
jgi:hypothetical protein